MAKRAATAANSNQKNTNVFKELTSVGKAATTSATPKIVNPVTTPSKAVVPTTLTPGKNTVAQKAEQAAVGKSTNPTPVMNSASNITANPIINTVNSNFQNKAEAYDRGMNTPISSVGKADTTDLSKVVNPYDSVGKSVATDTGMNANPAPSLLDQLGDTYINTGLGIYTGGAVPAVVDSNIPLIDSVKSAIIKANSGLRNVEDVTSIPNGSLTGAVLQNFYNSQAKSPMSGENRTQNTARRIQNMAKYDIDDEYEGKVNGSERARNLIDRSPRTEGLSAWERLLNMVNPDLVRGSAEGGQRINATSTGLADALAGRNDRGSKGGNVNVGLNGSNGYGSNGYGSNGGSGTSAVYGGGGRSTRSSSTYGNAPLGLGDLDLSTLYDLFNSRLNEYDNNYNSLIDSLMEMYGLNSSNLEDSYAQLLNALGLNYADTEGLLRSQYENSQSELENSRRRQLQEAYIARMMQQRNLGDQLDALGLTGGASETMLANLLNNYNNNRASVEEQIRSSLRDILNNYMTNQTSARQRYNDALMDAQQRQLNARQSLMNNLYNAQADALTNRARLRDIAYDDLFSTLSNLAAKGYQI